MSEEKKVCKGCPSSGGCGSQQGDDTVQSPQPVPQEDNDNGTDTGECVTGSGECCQNKENN